MKDQEEYTGHSDRVHFGSQRCTEKYYRGKDDHGIDNGITLIPSVIQYPAHPIQSDSDKSQNCPGISGDNLLAEGIICKQEHNNDGYSQHMLTVFDEKILRCIDTESVRFRRAQSPQDVRQSL